MFKKNLRRKKVDYLVDKFPSITDAKIEARYRLPDFVWEYLDSATGSEMSKMADRGSFDRVKLRPDVLCGDFEISMRQKFLDHTYSLPFGIGPVGMSGLIQPRAELWLGEAAAEHSIPYTLPTLATIAIEDLANTPSKSKWFQLYCPKDPVILQDLVTRALEAEYDSLVVTVDLPAASVRERQLRSGLTLPPRITWPIAHQLLRNPRWSISFLLNRPTFKNLTSYSLTKGLISTKHVGYKMRSNPDLDYLLQLRELWPKKLIIKGVSTASQTKKLTPLDADALWVSNHGGRQFQSGISSLESLREIRAQTDLPLIFDGGIESGLDIIKAYVLGADFVMLSRSWHYALAAFGKDGPAYLIWLLTRDLQANLAQMGCGSVSELNAEYIFLTKCLKT
ncbi:alpha-hydroxy-acid oxidizing protein [Luminiphilus sp.]|nr:alpha-hydroxy-acid oxidizing protein [Luminiphilus sp.]